MEPPPIHGNYQGYYTKRPTHSSDSRLALLPADAFKGKTVLDVGCNEGWVSTEIAQKWGASKVTGVDIDESLISGAWKRRKTVWSSQSPPPPPSATTKRKRHDSDSNPDQPPNSNYNYFPHSLSYMFGPLPIPPPTESLHFPNNLNFRVADWVNEGVLEDKDGYDVILALSVTKWIHLNGGDASLLTFFHRVFNSLREGGKFILEPQEWDNYGRARRMDAKLRDMAKILKIHPEDFERVLIEDVGFREVEKVGVAGEGGFRRSVYVYSK